jgi:hypothetical protein
MEKPKIGLLGAKLFKSRTVHDAAITARALDALFSDYVTPGGMTNPVLRSFTNAALHCSNAAEVTNIFNTAINRVGG